ncbi:hypothetical protein [Ensifer sp. MJa1]|uniref:hypothetical protein n=1 Tax=Ensifer sp. MJa1 TaxID=2919888 RepID=UPI003009687C
MTNTQRRMMKTSEISAFVSEVIGAGCQISAVGHDMYVIGDVEEQDAAIEEINRIGEKYGRRGPLRLEIVAYLRSIGRYVDVT